MHVRHGVHRGRGATQRRRHRGDAGRALERHQLDDPAHPQPDRCAIRVASQVPGGDLVHVRDGVHRGRELHHTTAGDWVTLAERWNGTSWTIQPTPIPPDAYCRRAIWRGSRARPPRRAPPSGTTSTAIRPVDAGRALERHQLDDPAHPQCPGGASAATWRGSRARPPRRAPPSATTNLDDLARRYGRTGHMATIEVNGAVLSLQGARQRAAAPAGAA